MNKEQATTGGANNALREDIPDGDKDQHGRPDQAGASTGGAGPVVVENDTVRVAVEVGRKRPGPVAYSSDSYVCRIELPVRSNNTENLRILISTLFAEAEQIVDAQFAKRRAAMGTGGQP